METKFLPPEKEPIEKVKEQFLEIENEIDKTFFLNVTPVIYLILNSKRQIVWANKTVMDDLDIRDINQILGQRPGELFKCIHAFETEGGCGTAEFCTTCGAAKAINEGLHENFDFQECQIEQINSIDALDLKVTSSPFSLNGDSYAIFTITDISHENRRRALERIFFHDIANTAGNINGYISVLDPANKEEFNSDKQILINLGQDLLDEINAQKILLNAENQELKVSLSQINSFVLMNDLVQKYLKHHLSTDKIILLSEDTVNYDFFSDVPLLKRVIGNMIKNAIEASNPGNKITAGCRIQNNCIEFFVHNITYIPRDIQLQLFHRSFSTKGSGRGLGTYSMKLLGEKYLGGKVSFTTSETEGTIFKISLPLM